MGGLAVKLFDLIKRSADDPKLNAAIKKSKDFRGLAVNVIAWALPMVLAYGISRLQDKVIGPDAAR